MNVISMSQLPCINPERVDIYVQHYHSEFSQYMENISHTLCANLFLLGTLPRYSSTESLAAYFLRINFALGFSPRYKYKVPVFISTLSIGSGVPLSLLEAGDRFWFLLFLHFFLLFGFTRRVDFELALAFCRACCLSCENVRFDCACRDLLFLSDSNCWIVIWPSSLLHGFWIIQCSFSSLAFTLFLQSFALVFEDTVFDSESSFRTAFSFIFSFLLNNGRPFLFGGSSSFVSEANGAFCFGRLLSVEEDVEPETIESVEAVRVVRTESGARLAAASLTSSIVECNLFDAASTLSPTNNRVGLALELDLSFVLTFSLAMLVRP
mmetsp:Transcript_38039/g.68521  ORF Transcript_38039/g.68521 Transcript_38039/m.68521 type:complete len:323 (-) Transcript_38039:291-1259(-)